MMTPKATYRTESGRLALIYEENGELRAKETDGSPWIYKVRMSVEDWLGPTAARTLRLFYRNGDIQNGIAPHWRRKPAEVQP